MFIFPIGQSAIAVRGPEERTRKEPFNPFTVGLDHVALGCEELKGLERVAQVWSEEGFENTGIREDENLGKKYIAFKDPDRISLEFYMI